MRKQFKLLLLVATVVALFAMAMIVGSAATIEVGTPEELIAAIGDCTAETPVAGTAQAGDTVLLTADLVLENDVKINLDKAITLDGGNHKIHFKSTTGFLIRFYSGGATVKDVIITSDMTTSDGGATNGLFTIAAGVNGTFTLDGVNAEIAGVIMRHMAAKATKTDGYTLVVKDSTLKSTDETARGFIFGQHCAATGVGTPRQSATFTNCTLDFKGQGVNLINFEGAVVTFDSCKITSVSRGAGYGLLYAQTLATDFVIKSESAPYVTEISCGNFSNLTKYGTITIGRDGQNDKITLSMTAYFSRNAKTYMTGVAIYGATINSSFNYMVGYMGLSTFVAKNTTFNMTQGGTVLEEYKSGENGACAATFENCTFTLAAEADYAQRGIYYNNQSPVRQCTISYKNCTVIVAATLGTVTTEGEGESAVTTVTPFALFDNNFDTLGEGMVFLAPGGTKLNSELAITPYAQDVKYKGDSYKIWYDIEGDLDTKTTTSIYVDVEYSATSGIRFNTEIDIWDLVDNFAGEFSFDETNILEELDGYKVNFYTVVAPLDYVVKAGGFTEFTTDKLDTLDVEGAKYVKIQANNTLVYNEDDEVVTYSGALINLKSYTRVYATIAMVEVVELESGEAVAVAYGNFSTTANAHSAQEVAVAVQDDEWSVAQKAIVDAYASGVKA